MYKKSLLILLLFISIPAIIKAQEMYLGPQVGWYKAADADNGKVLFGGAFRMKLSPTLGVEGGIYYRQEEYGDGNIKVTTWPVMVTGMFYPIPILYGAIGAGWYNTSITYSSELHLLGINDQTKQAFGWHFGAGVEIPMGQSMISADIRYVFLNYDFQTLPGSPGTKSDFVMVTVGWFFKL